MLIGEREKECVEVVSVIVGGKKYESEKSLFQYIFQFFIIDDENGRFVLKYGIIIYCLGVLKKEYGMFI